MNRWWFIPSAQKILALGAALEVVLKGLLQVLRVVVVLIYVNKEAEYASLAEGLHDELLLLVVDAEEQLEFWEHRQLVDVFDSYLKFVHGHHVDEVDFFFGDNDGEFLGDASGAEIIDEENHVWEAGLINFII